jgi:hypothetical protein
LPGKTVFSQAHRLFEKTAKMTEHADLAAPMG